MTENTEVTTVDDEDVARAALVTEWLELEERIEPLAKRITDIKAELEALPVGTRVLPGIPQKVQVTQARTFKPALFAAKYPATVPANLKYYGLVPDAAKIKDMLAPADLKACTALAKKSVKLA